MRLLWPIWGGEKVRADDEKTIENLREFYRNVGKQTFNDRPDYWDEQKAKRRYERQRKYVLDEKRRKLRKNVEQEKELQEIAKRIKTGQKARWRENYIFSQSSGCPFWKAELLCLANRRLREDVIFNLTRTSLRSSCRKQEEEGYTELPLGR